MTSTELVEVFEKYSSGLVNQFFPEKLVLISDKDNPYMTEELRLLRRQRQRVHAKWGKTDRYFNLQSLFDQKLKQEAEKYRIKIETEVSEGKRGNSYSALRKLDYGTQNCKQSFSLPNYEEEDLSPAQSAERLAGYFSSISQEFEPINSDEFPPWIKEKLKDGRLDSSKPILEEWQVYLKLKHSKKPNSLIPGDLPVKLIKEFTPEIAKPVSVFYNKITQSGVYPRQWVVEYQIAIPKVYPPMSEDDTRNIASTAYLSKQYESFIKDWILPYVEPFLDLKDHQLLIIW